MSVFHFRAGRKWAAALGSTTLVLACRAAPARVPMPGRDDFGDSIVAGPATPERIVSLSPATTEILFALGAGRRLVGRTHWDISPDSATRVRDLGNGIRPNVESILAVRPDLVVLYATEDNRDADRSLRSNHVAVVALRLDRIADFARATTVLGGLVGADARARLVVDSVSATLDRVRATTAPLPRPTVFVPFYEQPLLVIGGGSFISELIAIAGGRNIFADLASPSPQVSFEEVLRRNPDYIMAGPKVLAFVQADPRWRALTAIRAGHVLTMDTSLVELPGVRLGEAAASIAHLLHPGAVP